MSKVIALLLVLICLVIMVAPVAADEPEDGNECFDGGTLAGKCTTEFEFVCGYNLYRFNHWEGDNGLVQWAAVFNDAHEMQPWMPVVCEIYAPPIDPQNK